MWRAANRRAAFAFMAMFGFSKRNVDGTVDAARLEARATGIWDWSRIRDLFASSAPLRDTVF
jgi:hypothetical protein